MRSGPGALVAVLLTAGADGAELVVYDNTAASGTVMAHLKAGAGTTVAWSPAIPYGCDKGIYASVAAGTSPRWVVVYR